jgi:Ribbon-helix-helix protein, copG family
MTNEAKCRHQLYLDRDVSEKLQALAAKPGASKSAILADAVQAWLTRRGTQELDDRFALRLERISTQLARIERDQQVMMESQALFIRYQLTINAPLPEPDQAARAVGRHRFQSFIDQVGRNIAGGNRTLGRVEAMNGEGKDKP